MSGRIVRSVPAKRDVIELTEYLSRDSLAVAKRFKDAVKTTTKLLARTPGLGAAWETQDPRLVGMRWWQVKGFPNHIIFFRSIPKGIEILRVVHASRDLQSLFSKE